MSPGGLRRGAALLLVVPLLAACSESYSENADEQDLCDQYDDVVAAVEDIKGLDPSATSADELRAATADVRAELDQLRSVAEGRLDTVIATLRTDLDGIRQAANQASGKSLDAARELLEESFDDLAMDWAALQQAADDQCGAG